MKCILPKKVKNLLRSIGLCVCGCGCLARIEKSIEVKASTEKVWPMLYWDRLPDWLEIIKAAEYTSEEKNNVGATAHVTVETAGVNVEWDVEITEYIEDEKATWRSTAGNLTAIGLTILRQTEAGTKVTFVIDYELPYSVLGKIIDKLMVSREAERGIERG